MQDALRDFIDNTFRTFDQYHVTDPAMLREIEDLRAKYVELAEKTGDVMSFCQAAPGAGIYEAYTRVATKIVMKENQAKADETAEKPYVRPTVHEYLSQYRPGYEEVAKHPERARAKAAYERLFAIEKETDDLITAEILLEERRSAWEIVYYDALDTFEARLKDMDPLFEVTTATILNSIQAVKESHSSEEMYYRTAVHEVQSLYDGQAYYAKMVTVVHLALRLIEYCSAKRDFYRAKDDNLRRAYVNAMLSKRREIRKVLAFMEEAFRMSYEDLLGNEGLKIWLLSPETADDGKALGRLRSVMHPQNYAVFTEIIYEEIRPERSAAEILMRRPENVLWYKL